MTDRLTPRQRARLGTIEEIKRLARDQLARVGSSGLSLREIARDLNIVSSAVYRYFPSRDELLTELIVEAYDTLGAATEAAASIPDGARAGDGARVEERWLAIGHAVRAWALAHPAEYALVYGSPVPGYHAPGDRTIVPATRVPVVLLALLADIEADVEHLGGVPSGRVPPAPPSLRADFDRMRAIAGRPISDDLLLAGLAAWSFLFGAVSLEVFGQLTNVITDRDAYFDHQLRRIAVTLGLGSGPVPG